jgi:hypothetical protein
MGGFGTWVNYNCIIATLMTQHAEQGLSTQDGNGVKALHCSLGPN